jgi:hypothetical protein
MMTQINLKSRRSIQFRIQIQIDCALTSHLEQIVELISLQPSEIISLCFLWMPVIRARALAGIAACCWGCTAWQCLQPKTLSIRDRGPDPPPEDNAGPWSLGEAGTSLLTCAPRRWKYGIRITLSFGLELQSPQGPSS